MLVNTRPINVFVALNGFVNLCCNFVDWWE